MEPGHDGVAVLTMELQRGVCGDLAALTTLREAVERTGVEVAAARLVTAARVNAIDVVHCTFALTPDRADIDLDLPLMSNARRDPGYMAQGSPAASLLASLGPEDTDHVVERHRGVSPFTGTRLHQLLQTLGVGTLVVCGVSLNLGVLGAVIEAVGLGYRTTVAVDAVAGIPAEYGDAVVRHSISPIARLATVDEIVDEMTRTTTAPGQ